MKVLFQGVDPGNKLMKGTCNCCNTVVEFTKDEARFRPADSGIFEDVDSYTIKCPVCENNIWGYP